MGTSVKSMAILVQYLLHRLAFGLIVLAALAGLAASLCAALGLAPWLEFSVGYGTQTYANAGMIAQIGLTTLAVMLCFFLPANRRVMALENAHRAFHLKMEDVTRAYAAAHAADRGHTFQLASEFDSVRERLLFLRDHPDLGTLEPEILEVAAQMSHVSKDLAETYSQTKVARAKAFLTQRQQEVRAFNDRLEAAKADTIALKHWMHEIEMDERVSATQFDRIRDELLGILDKLEGVEVQLLLDNVVDLPKKAAE